MAEFRLERFKYNWRGTWTADTAYKRDDVVRVNGKSYVCIITHVSSSTFRTDLNAILPGSIPPQPQPKWTVMTNGTSFTGDWETSRDYDLGDVVNYQGNLWTCSQSHQSSEFAFDVDNWVLFTKTASYQGDWQPSTSYSEGAIARYNGNVYRCVNSHYSQVTLENNSTDWEEYLIGLENRGDWEPNTEYRVNDLVKYGPTVFRCIETHTSNQTNLEDDKFSIEVYGTQFEQEWEPTKYYNIGDIVRHRGFMYFAINNNFVSRPYDDNSSPDWILISRTYNFLGDYDSAAEYKTGDIVLRGGHLYLALRDIAEEIFDGSTLDYLDGGTWELLIPGTSWKGNWTAGTIYRIGDTIYHKGSAYTCNIEHEASMVNFPGDNGSGFDYWDTLIQAGLTGALQEKGDILTYGLSREIDNDGSTVYDDSTKGDTRLRIGNTEQVLAVSEELEVFWRDIVEDAEAIYVATNGLDDDGRGTFQKPFRTIRYAAEYVEDNFDPLTPVIIRVSGGKFEEIGPIIVPAGCAVNGDELRSTTVLANPPLAAYQNDYPRLTAGLTHFFGILSDVIQGVEIIPQAGNTVEQPLYAEVPLFDENGDPVLDAINQEQVLVGNGFPKSDSDAADFIVNLISDYTNIIEFNIGNGDVNPVLQGSNELSEQQNLRLAAEALQECKSFLKAEMAAFYANTYPNDNISELKIKDDFWSLMRGVIRDLTYSGNYGTLIAGIKYSNAVNGSQSEDLFLMRDSTGLRDLTTGGLRGILNPPGVFDLYQKPTGGACVALDPGWGVDDQRTWIINRSPYIQGVTNTGVGCIGMKVDGALHTGGNKSMTANDFTQVLSDGIGAWITNNARAELVSVFTYYCQIGYFAEDGGIIRAANGNNSYGRYGSIADGVDDTEIPQEVTAFNRNNDAIISEAFAGGTADEFFIFEFSNAGEQYTNATATISGAGSNASTEFRDFRDGGLFQARLTSPDGSGNAGGAGYVRRQGNAQETTGASSTIKLSQNDITQFLSEIQGMRIIITDGTGVGQYGYIDDFDFATKTVTVRRDSDDELGWDHIIPGTPIAANLDLTTRYTIEARVVVTTDPVYAATNFDLFTNRQYVDSVFGDFTETFANVTAGSDVLWRDVSNTRITIKEIISDTAMQFNAYFIEDPILPLNIRGRTSGATATITQITAKTDTLIETELDLGATNFEVGEEIDLILAAGTGETFDDEPTAAIFSVTRQGSEYVVTLTDGGAGYEEGNVITISGAQLGGTTPENDLTITINTVSADSTSSILTFTTSGVGRTGRFVTLTDTEYLRYSDNGTSWTEVSASFTAGGNFNTLLNGNNRFIAVAEGQGRVSSSLNGVVWNDVELPITNAWQDGVYGGGKFLIVGNDTDLVLYSTDGETWNTSSIPDDAVGDSTIAQWSHITYGDGTYVVASANDRATAISLDGINWTRNDQALPNFTGTIVDITFGKNKFVILTDIGEVGYSFDGVTWYALPTDPISGSSLTGSGAWRLIDYAQGVFVAIAAPEGINTGTDIIATSEDGVLWTQRQLGSIQPWTSLVNGKVDGTYKWILLASGATSDAGNILNIGCRPLVRASIGVGFFEEIKIWDPGSGYTQENLPVIAVTDPNNTLEVTTESRVGNGVIAQPDFINRGAGYRRSTSTIAITGDGYADIIPEEAVLTVAGVVNIPGPGVQIEIDGVVDPEALIPGDLFTFSGVTVKDLGDDGTGNETRLVEFQISPRLETYLNVRHGTRITLREKFSQCRISGHDFLDIGTGNFESTNYPEIYAGGAFFTAAPENEVLEQNGGRVFYVSTDQDGNFRTGELFSVQQATGIVTISAQFFDLDGLSELALGGVRLGGSGTVVNEFSTDPTFSADSNNVIPTQRAIVTFLADRLSVGGESLEVNRLQAGRVILGGTANEIGSVLGSIEVPVQVIFDGTFETDDGEGNITTEQTAISGTIVSQMMYFKQFDETMQ